LQTQQLSANVGLIKALGGGWNVAQLTGVNQASTAAPTNIYQN